jgi:hypothetical protein
MERPNEERYTEESREQIGDTCERGEKNEVSLVLR